MITNIVVATITAYCHCTICTKGTGITANGNKPKEGITIAASRTIPLGATVITSHGFYTVQDRLASRYDSRFDIYFSAHEKAKRFGIKKNQKVTIIMP